MHVKGLDWSGVGRGLHDGALKCHKNDSPILKSSKYSIDDTRHKLEITI